MPVRVLEDAESYNSYTGRMTDDTCMKLATCLPRSPGTDKTMFPVVLVTEGICARPQETVPIYTRETVEMDEKEGRPLVRRHT